MKSTLLVNLYSLSGIKASEADYEAATASVGLLTRQESPSALNCLLSAHRWLTVDLRTAHFLDSKYLPLFNYSVLRP